MSNCSHKNPLLHSGSSQYNRVLKALDPAFAKIDERSPADLILFAKEYSKYLTFYNQQHEPDGTWQPLMQMDVSVVLATLGNQRVNDYKNVIRQNLQWLADKENKDLPELAARFTFLFDFTYSWLYELETQCRLMPAEWPYKSWLTDTIRATLAVQRYKLDAWFLQALANDGIIDYKLEDVQPGLLVPFKVESAAYLRTQAWQSYWAYEPADGRDFIPTLNGILPIDKIKNTATHNLFTGIFDAIFKQGSLITQNAIRSLDESLNDFPQHTPHYALFLAFIKLFRFAQDELNTYTQRHLDFYYKDLLQLQPAKAVPDQAHLLVTLQKNVSQYLLPKGTLFKGGKNAAGQQEYYAAEKEVLINKTAVAALQALRVISDESGPDRLGIFAAPVANSADGRGAAITSADQSWQPFGPVNTDSFASIGFALASDILYMKEGTRRIILTFEAAKAFPDNDRFFDLRPAVELSGSKGWITATVERFDTAPDKLDIINRTGSCQLICNLPADADPVLPFNNAIHGGGYNTPYPVIRVLFSTASTDVFNAQQEWAKAGIRRIAIDVEVNGVKQLTVRNDTSILDTTKPFMPFGPTPYAGSACIIGSSEIFRKRAANVTLHLDWDKIPQPEGIFNHMSRYKTVRDASGKDTAATIPDAEPIGKDGFKDGFSDAMIVDAGLEQLIAGRWEGDRSKGILLFSARELFGNNVVDGVAAADIPANVLKYYPKDSFKSNAGRTLAFNVKSPASADQPYSHSSQAGFVKLVLNTDLGHKDYIQRFTFLAGQAKKTPLEPYTPLLKSLTADYTASQEIDLSAPVFADVPRDWQFFSLHPFGLREEANKGGNATFSMLPSFEEEGELYIGLDTITPNTRLQLLFQVSEGSANPLRNKEAIQWQYLAADQYWRSFEESMVSDETNGLLRSGIVAVTLPEDMAPAPTLMGNRLYWLKVIVKQHVDAICNLVAVHAQAIKVIWTDNGNSLLQYTHSAPAGTITKPDKAITEIKKLEQPYNSFGGRLPETDQQFYLRSSERLRHKQRAITIWDYERLVLQAFPEIYRVKCLNHTKTTASTDNELAPGCVVVVPVPDISRQANRNPLRPMTSLDTLTAIEKYLRNITSGFTRLQVRNPVFEEVVIQCDVKFRDNPAYYHNVLLTDLQQFMCPWAYNPQQELEFGGKINKSTLISFLEERPYVDYLAGFRMYLRDGNGALSQDQEEIVTTTSRSILVSAPVALHTINIIQH